MPDQPRFPVQRLSQKLRRKQARAPASAPGDHRKQRPVRRIQENARQILSKEQILEHVWDADGQFVDDNTVPVNISRLKSKLGESYIQNVRGIGYIWTEESFR